MLCVIPFWFAHHRCGEFSLIQNLLIVRCKEILPEVPQLHLTVNYKHIPHICHESHEHSRVNFFLPVQIFTDITRKIGNLLCKLAIYCVNHVVNFIFQKFCPSKKNDKLEVWIEWSMEWCTDDSHMMHWRCIEDALMIHRWCSNDVLMMH